MDPLYPQPSQIAPGSAAALRVICVPLEQVFSNFVEYAVDYDRVPTKDPKYPASESWTMTNNWLAGITNGAHSIVD